jgi:hypothetical protein
MRPITATIAHIYIKMMLAAQQAWLNLGSHWASAWRTRHNDDAKYAIVLHRQGQPMASGLLTQTLASDFQVIQS